MAHHISKNDPNVGTHISSNIQHFVLVVVVLGMVVDDKQGIVAGHFGGFVVVVVVANGINNGINCTITDCQWFVAVVVVSPTTTRTLVLE